MEQIVRAIKIDNGNTVLRTNVKIRESIFSKQIRSQQNYDLNSP